MMKAVSAGVDSIGALALAAAGSSARTVEEPSPRASPARISSLRHVRILITGSLRDPIEGYPGKADDLRATRKSDSDQSRPGQSFTKVRTREQGKLAGAESVESS